MKDGTVLHTTNALRDTILLTYLGRFLEMASYLYVHVEDHYLNDLLVITHIMSKWHLAPSYERKGRYVWEKGHGMVLVLAGGSLAS
jgi:hypothetical protein